MENLVWHSETQDISFITHTLIFLPIRRPQSEILVMFATFHWYMSQELMLYIIIPKHATRRQIVRQGCHSNL